MASAYQDFQPDIEAEKKLLLKANPTLKETDLIVTANGRGIIVKPEVQARLDELNIQDREDNPKKYK